MDVRLGKRVGRKGEREGEWVAAGEIGNHSKDLQKGEWVRHGWEKDCAEPNGPK